MKTLALLSALVLATPGHAATPRHPDALDPVRVELTLPTPAEFTLANGLRVILFENHELPLVSLSAGFAMGTRYLEPAEYPALDALEALWGAGGAGERGPEDFDAAVSALGLELEPKVSGGCALLNALMLAEDLEAGARLWRDLLLAPAFDEERIARTRAQMIKELQGLADEPWQLVATYYERLLSGPESPQGRIASREEIEAIDGDALRTLYQRFLGGGTLVLGVHGDVTEPQIRALLEGLVGTWTGAGREATPVARLAPRVTRPGVFVFPGEFSQCHLRMGRPIPDLTDTSPEVSLARMLSYGLGYLRVFMRTRAEGLSYGTTTLLSQDADRGQFWAMGNTRPEGILPLIRAVREETAALPDRPLTAEEVESIRLFMLGSALSVQESPSYFLESQIADRVTGRGADYARRMVAGYQAADEASLAATAARWASFGDEPVVMVLGTPDGGPEALEGLGLGPVTVLEPLPLPVDD